MLGDRVRCSSPIVTSMLTMMLAGCGIVTEPPVPGSGKVTSENRTLDSFSSISVALGADVDVRKGDATTVTITTDDNLLPRIRSVVADGQLKIDADGNLAPTKRIKVAITTPSVSSFSIAGSGVIKIEQLTGPKTSVSIAGTSDITTAVAADEFTADIAGAGTVNATGTAKKVAVSIAGSGDIQTNGIAADAASVEIAGSGTVSVHANTSLDVSIAGSGDVRYSGSPADIKQSIAGSGTVSQMPAATQTTAPPAESLSDQPGSTTDAASPAAP